MRLLFLQFSLVLLVAGARGATKILEGTLEVLPEHGGVVLRVGADAVPIVAYQKTRFWIRRAPAASFKAFHVGDAVVARLDPDRSPAALRELADKESWAWLEGIRKGVRDGVARSLAGDALTIAYDDGSEMVYRVRPRTEVTLGGKPAGLSDLRAGSRLWLKGRTLANLDVWAVTISDRAPVVLPKKTTRKKGEAPGTPPKLAAAGTLAGKVGALYPDRSLFDLLVDGARLHVSYVAATVFVRGGAKAGPTDLAQDREATVRYRRDAYGRLVADRVEIR